MLGNTEFASLGLKVWDFFEFCISSLEFGICFLQFSPSYFVFRILYFLFFEFSFHLSELPLPHATLFSFINFIQKIKNT
ncbi:hypothetical protein EMGBS15_15460 [Filimonas sp.]|nr:hypothetical protein EMGBS15_15460 [Filimonas sp.]